MKPSIRQPSRISFSPRTFDRLSRWRHECRPPSATGRGRLSPPPLRHQGQPLRHPAEPQRSRRRGFLLLKRPFGLPVFRRLGSAAFQARSRQPSRPPPSPREPVARSAQFRETGATPTGSASCLATVSGTLSEPASLNVFATNSLLSVLLCAILRLSALLWEPPETSSQSGIRPWPSAGHAWTRRSVSLQRIGKWISLPPSPVLSGFGSVYRPWSFSPLSLSRLMGPQAGQTEEQRSSAMRQ